MKISATKMDSSALMLLSVFCLTTFFCWPAREARAQTGRITGTVVTAATGEALAKASIEAVETTAARKLGTFTDKTGRYAMEGVPAGTYTLEASFVGYRVGRVENVRVEGDESVEIDFELATKPYKLDETVISASRRQENIIDAPASVVKVEAEEIQRKTTSNSYMSMIRDVKGIDYFQNSILSERINARGFNSAFNYRMLILMDGRVSSTPSIGLTIDASTPIPKDDVQDIEVITGPGSALYGPDATSGVVSVTTKDPRRFPGTSVAVAGGSRSTLKSRFYHAGLHRQ